MVAPRSSSGGIERACAVANTAPLLAKRLFGHLWAYPLDCNVAFLDGRPLFGKSKTMRGLVASLAATVATAPIVGLTWTTGLLVGGTAMAGDLFSSFLKRRLNLPPSSKATGLDQLPESLIPLLACRAVVDVSAIDIVVAASVFFVGEVVFARLFYALKLRDRPY
jgi:CDP-2,3-bis-(O-geranylgeranyl)-sn-glycerol synthase